MSGYNIFTVVKLAVYNDENGHCRIWTRNTFSARCFDVPRRRPEAAATVASFAPIAAPAFDAITVERWGRGGGEETAARGDARWFGVGEKADRFFHDVGPFGASSRVATAVHRSLRSALAARVLLASDDRVRYSLSFTERSSNARSVPSARVPFASSRIACRVPRRISFFFFFSCERTRVNFF